MIAEIRRWKDLSDWLPSGGDGTDIAAHFGAVALGDFLHRTTRPIDKASTPLDSLNVIEKISFGGVLHIRDADKKRDYKGPLFRAKPGELVFSKIRIGQGSLCVVPEGIDHLAVSPEYPVYRVDQRQVRPRFLDLLLRAPDFQKLFCASSSGNTTKKRIGPDLFEAVSVPLPDTEEQDRLLARYDSANAVVKRKFEEAKNAELHSNREFEEALGLTPPANLPRKLLQVARFEEIDRWSHEGILDRRLLAAAGNSTERFPLVSLGDVVADLENGWSPQCLDRQAEHDEWGVLKLGAVSFGEYDERQNKALPSRLKPQKDIEVGKGDVLISRANVLRLVGACAIVRMTRPKLMLCDKIFRVVFLRQSPINPEFLVELMKLPSVRQQIEAAATGTSPTMKNISKPSLLDLTFPLPQGDAGLKTQQELISKLRAARESAASLRKEATTKRAAAWDDFLNAVFH